MNLLKTLAYLDLGSACLSVLGCLFIIIIQWKFKPEFSFNTIIFQLTISDLLLSLVIIIFETIAFTAPYTDAELATLQIMSYIWLGCQILSFVWIFFLSLSTFRKVTSSLPLFSF